MGARVLYWSRSQATAEFTTVLAESDIVSLHLPLTPDTRNFIDPRKMKRRSILINTARGGLVDEALLLQCVKEGHLAALGVDVLAEEPAAAGHPLLSYRNVVCAPHVAWLTRETLERSLAAAAENVRRLRAGEPLLHRVA
jgi:phosphoglycerate dehydrogenase-like enzyme